MNNSITQNFLQKRSVRISLTILAALWLIFVVLFYVSYRTAYAHLQLNNPSELNNRSELQVFYAPLKLSKGEEFSMEDLTTYFNELGYEISNTESMGIYYFSENSISFVSRSEAFPQGEIFFENGHIKKIISDRIEVKQIELEALPMRSFIKFVKDDSLKDQRIRRIVLSPNAIPEVLSDAVTSTEDTRYFQHYGIDVFGMSRRIITLKGGGSSITQQLIKNNVIKGSNEEFWQKVLGFLPAKYQRKLMEIPFALAAEEMMTKDEILAAYLSMIPLAASEGVELHGVVSASQEYFGKSLSELTLAESALLTGIINKPSYYVSLARENKYEKLIVRRNIILDLMHRNYPEKYSSEVIEKAKDEPIKFVFASANRTERPADAYSRLFSAYVANHLPENLSELRNNEGNLQIFTTLDYRLQKSATDVAEKASAEISKKVQTECLRQKPVNVDCNSIKPQISIVAMEAETGEILAMYGGSSLNINFALSKRSPASTIKPFYYLLALEEGIWNGKPFTPETIIDPETDVVSFRPQQNMGIRSTATQGLTRSYNFHAVAALESVGLKNGTEFVGKLTNSSPEINGVSAIGGSEGSETSLLDLVSAYSVFANQGVLVKAEPNKFYLQNNEKFNFPKHKAERIASTQSAVSTNEMMKLVLSKNGTAPSFKQLANMSESVEISGKTGSGMVADLWFFAVTPKVVVGVWVGMPKNEIELKAIRGFTGGSIASPIAAKFIKSLQKTNPNLLGAK